MSEQVEGIKTDKVSPSSLQSDVCSSHRLVMAS